MTPVREWTMRMVSPAKRMTRSSTATLSLKRYHPAAPASAIRARPKTAGIRRQAKGVSPKIAMLHAMMNLPKGGCKSKNSTPRRYLSAMTGK
jgi:hypothetical protein